MNNRQAGRRRGRGGQRPQSGGSPNRQDNGNRIDSRARGNAAQLLEKYKNLARDSQMQGDRVNTEYYLQFADHYFRVLSETRSRFEENGGQRRQHDDAGDEDDFDMDGDGGTADYRDQREARDDRGNGNRENNNRENGQRDAGQRDDRSGQRGDRGDGNVQREANRGNGGQRDGNRESSNRENGQREARDNGRDRDQDQPRAEPNRDRPRREPRIDAPRAQPQPEPVIASADAPVEEAPRRRGRPRRQPAEAAIEVTGESTGIEADRLPPSLGFANDDNAEEAPAEKPRRRRRVRGEDEVVPTA